MLTDAVKVLVEAVSAVRDLAITVLLVAARVLTESKRLLGLAAMIVLD